MIGDDLRLALGLPLVEPVKPKFRCYPSRGRQTHDAYVYPHPNNPMVAVVRWYYKGVRKTHSWWIRREDARSIGCLRSRLSRYEPTILVHTDLLRK